MRPLITALIFCVFVTFAAFAQSGLSPNNAANEQGQYTREPAGAANQSDPPNKLPTPAQNSDQPTEAGSKSNKQKDDGVRHYLNSMRGAVLSFFEFAERNDKAIVAIGTLLIAAFTVVLGIATAFLYKATRDLVQEAKDTSERQLRAYVGIERIYLSSVAPNTPIQLKVVFKNYGQTPAYRECANISAVGMPPEHEDVIFEVTNPDVYPTTLMPGEISIMTMPFEEMGPMYFNDILARGDVIWVGGSIDYTDAFGKRRTTKVKMFAPRGSVNFLSLPNVDEAS